MKSPTRMAMIAALAAAFLTVGGKGRGPTNDPVPDTARAAEVSTPAAGPSRTPNFAGNLTGSALGMNR